MKTMQYFAPAIGWGIFIFIISTIPGKDIPEIPSLWNLIKTDKLVHMSVYGVLSWLILRGWFKTHENQTRWHYVKFSVLIALCCSLLGLFLEWFQEHYCQDRMFELLDALANTIGAFGGAMGYFIFKRFRQTI